MDSSKIDISKLTREILQEAAESAFSVYDLQESIQKKMSQLSKEFYLNQHGKEYSENCWEFYIPFQIKKLRPEAKNLTSDQLKKLQNLHKQNYLSDIMTRLINKYSWIGDWHTVGDGQWLAIADREVDGFYNKQKKELPISEYDKAELDGFHATLAEHSKSLTEIKNEIKQAAEVYEERFYNFLSNRVA